MVQELKILISLFRDFLSRVSSNNRIAITYTGGVFEKPEGFFLYVGVAGNVNYTDINGHSGIQTFTAGYHPTKLLRVTEASTTATNLAACFN